MDITAESHEQTKRIANEIAQKVSAGAVLALHGDLGSGKTTFSKYLAESLGFIDRVQSPTFVITRTYKKGVSKKIKKIHHVDLYRITDQYTLKELYLEELLSDKEAVTLIEWPEIAETLLPQNRIDIYFELGKENERHIKIQNNY